MDYKRRILLFTLATSAFIPAFSQTQEPMLISDLQPRAIWNNVYLQGLIGANFSISEDTRTLKPSKLIKWGTDVSLGKHFTPYWGGAIDVLYNRNIATVHYSVPNRPVNNFRSLEVYLCLNYDLTNGFKGYRPGRKGHLYISVGAGAAYSDHLELTTTNEERPSTNNLTYALRGAISYIHNLTNRVSLATEISGHFLGDNFNGRVQEIAFDTRPNIMIGARIHLVDGYESKPTGKPKWIHYVDRIVTDTVRVVERVEVPTATNEQGLYASAKIYPIFFAINSIEIRESEQGKMDEMAQYLKDHPEKTVFIIGHADRNTGNERINYYLGKNRSRVVGERLTSYYGINSSRIVSIQEEGDKVQPFKINYENNRVAICIISDFKE